MKLTIVPFSESNNPIEENVTIVRAKLRDLGFTEHPSTREVARRISQLGMFCTIDIANRLRAVCEESDNFWIVGASTPGGETPIWFIPLNGEGALQVFKSPVGRVDRLDIDEEVVFVRR